MNMINDIIELELERINIELCLLECNDDTDILKNIINIHKYIYTSYKSGSSNTLYKLLTTKRGDSYTFSLLFKTILDRIKIDNYILESNDTFGNHFSNVININNKNYIFDSYLESELNSKDKTIRCAGLGREYYSKLYKFNDNKIAISNLDIDMINYYNY